MSRATGSALPRGTGRACLKQSLAAVGAADHHGVVGSQVPRGPVLGLEGTRRVGRSAEGPGLLEAPLPALREALVVLELVGVVLVDPKSRRRLRLHVFRRHRHRLVRPGVVGLRRLDPTAPWLTIEGCAGRPGQRHPPGQRGHRPGGQPAVPVPLRRHHGAGDEHQVCRGHGGRDPGGFCELAVINQAPTGVARLFLATNNNGAGGKGELVALASGGLQLNALNELMSFNTTSGLANMFIEPNTGGNNNGEVIFGYGHMNASDRKLKQNIRKIPQKQAQQLFDELEPKIYDRVEGPKDQIGFVAQDVLAAGELGKALCKPMGDGELLALDYQKLSVVLWGVVKSLQKRVDKLEKKRGRSN